MDNALFDSKELECYLRKKAAKNVPEVITDKHSVQAILKRRRIVLLDYHTTYQIAHKYHKFNL